MYVDEDLVAGFIRYENMILIVRIFESELAEPQRVLGSKPNGRDVFSKLLGIRCVEIIFIGSSN